MSGQLRDEFEVLVHVQHGATGKFGGRRDQKVRYRRRAMLAPFGQQPLHLHRPISMAGVEYSTGMAARGAVAKARVRSLADLAEEPTSSRVTVEMTTSPRWIRDAQSAAAWLRPSRTRADLSMSQVWSRPRLTH